MAFKRLSKDEMQVNQLFETPKWMNKGLRYLKLTTNSSVAVMVTEAIEEFAKDAESIELEKYNDTERLVSASHSDEDDKDKPYTVKISEEVYQKLSELAFRLTYTRPATVQVAVARYLLKRDCVKLEDIPEQMRVGL